MPHEIFRRIALREFFLPDSFFELSYLLAAHFCEFLLLKKIILPLLCAFPRRHEPLDVDITFFGPPAGLLLRKLR
jgi:hypothetical protein